MPTEPKQILAVAKALSTVAEDKIGSEAMFRSSVSRAYYSVYHLMGHTLPVHGYEGQYGSHAIVLEAVHQEPLPCDDFIMKAKRWLATLKADREKSDYRLEKRVSKRDAELAVERARSIFDAIAR